MNKVRVRFAPSPTGPLHIGGVRTALYNYLFAKKQGGVFLLRIEDTDAARFVAGAEEYIVNTLHWLGIQIDEGIGAEESGSHAPYRQSERKTIYKQYVDQLVHAGKAYVAFDTPVELDIKRAEVPNFQYDASTRESMVNSLTLSHDEVQKRIVDGEQYVVRIKIEPDKDLVVQDLIRGEVHVSSSVLDDKVLFKSSDNLPTYHLANVVDDYLMEISHVIRGEEWLPSAPLHVLLYEYLGWTDQMPAFAHLPLLLKPDGNGKLSKRDGDRLGFPVFPLDWHDSKSGVDFPGYRESGYFPEAVVNFLALLGWNPGTEQELFSMEELIELFSLDRVSKSGAKFDYEKGKWFNHQYLQAKPLEEITDQFYHYLVQKDQVEDWDKVLKVVGLIRERVDFIHELWNQGAFFFVAPEKYDEKAVKKRWKADSSIHIAGLIDLLQQTDDFTAAHTEKVVKSWIEANNLGIGVVMNAFRLAIVGASQGPHMFDIIEVIGKDETIRRLQRAVEFLGKKEQA